MQIKRSEWVVIALSICLFGILLIMGRSTSSGLQNKSDNGNLALTFSQIENELDEYLDKPENYEWLIQWADGTLSPDLDIISQIEAFNTRPFQIGIVRNGALQAWSAPAILNTIPTDYPDGWYLVRDSIFQKKITSRNSSDTIVLLAQMTLPGTFTLKPSELSTEQNINSVPIRTKEQKIIAYPLSQESVPGHNMQVLMTIFYLLAYLTMILAAASILRNNKNKINKGHLVLIICIPVFVRLLDYLSGIGLHIDLNLISLGVADKPFLSRTYGHLLLLLIFYFIYTEYILDNIRPAKWLRRVSYGRAKYSFILFLLDYFGLICLLIFCRELVVNSGINFDFNNVFKLGAGPLSSIIILSVLLFRYFLFSYKINLNLFKNKIQFKYKAIGVIASFLIMLPLIYLTDLNLPIFILLLVVLLFSLLFDLFIETKSPSLGWLVVWIMFFASFATVSLFKFNKDKEREEKLALIDQISIPDDSLFFAKFANIITTLKNNKQLNAAFSNAIRDENSALGVETLNIALSKESYLQNFYSIDFYVRSRDTIAITSQPNLSSQLNLKSVKFEETKAYLKAYNPAHFHSYFLKVYWQGLDIKPSPEIYFIVKKKLIAPQSGISETGSYFMNITDLRKYDYAIYRNDILSESQGRIYPDNIDSRKILEENEMVEISTQKRSELTTRIDAHTVIIIGKELLGLIKPISLFSFLFVLLILMAIIVSLLNSWTKILPVELPLLFSSQFNLRQRIEYSILLLIVTSFGIIAWITSIYFRDLSFKMEENQLANKAFAMVADIENKIQSEGTDSIGDLQLSTVSIAHQTEFNIYNNDGALSYRSRKDLASDPSGETRIDALAYLKLNFEGLPIYNHIDPESKSIDKAYLPVKNGNQVRIGWLEVPYTNGSSTNYFAVSDFLGTLLNVYVFLLLVAGAIAIGVANSITKPLVRLVDKLKLIKLDKKNEPLQWSQHDEIGSLIMEYNNMIEKLEESATLLVKSEREGAWRDMAQQVAHEIKNPLTPMKLSIQYLERKIISSPKEDMEQIVKDTARTVIEQIDNLASIATEFSNFAKMPAPVMEYINFNELVSSIHELFRKKDDMHFNLYVPIDDLIILADRSHLLRVLNNLVQNAIQSIPPERTGQIGLQLKVEEGMAVLKVKDNGLGIPESMFEKVFYPRFTTKSSGMGLGLAMCKSIVESLSGEISFNSRVDIGTEFIVKIPLVIASTEEDAEEIEPDTTID